MQRDVVRMTKLVLSEPELTTLFQALPVAGLAESSRLALLQAKAQGHALNVVTLHKVT